MSRFYDSFSVLQQAPPGAAQGGMDSPALAVKANRDLDQMEAEAFATRTPPAPSEEPPLKRGRPPTSGMKNHPSYAAMVRRGRPTPAAPPRAAPVSVP